MQIVLNNHGNIPNQFDSKCYIIYFNTAQLHPKYGGLGLLTILKHLDVIRFMNVVKIIRFPESSTFHVLSLLSNILTKPWILRLYGLHYNWPKVNKQINNSPCIKSLGNLITYCPINKLSQPLIPSLIPTEPLFFNHAYKTEITGYRLNSWTNIALAGITMVQHIWKTWGWNAYVWVPFL